MHPELRRAFLGAASKNNPGQSRLGAAGLTNIRLEKPDMSRLSFMPSFTSDDALRAHQLAGLTWTVRHAREGSPFYRARLDAAGVGPDDLRTLEDVAKLPLTTADDLRDHYPFPLRAVPYEQIVRIHSSSGTTGKRKILCYTQKDVDDWAHFFARCYEMAGVTPLDRVQIAVGYGLWTAGVGFQAGCERVGAMAVPTGPGNLDLQCEFLVDLQSTVLCCTASMGLLLAEEIHKRGLADKINLKKVIYGSERSSRSMRKKISDLLGGAELFDIPGLTELYGPGHGDRVPAPRLHPLLGRLLHARDPRPRHTATVAARRVGRDGGHHAGERGGTAHPVPDPRHHPDHSRGLHVRIAHAAPFEDQRANRRRVQVPGREHLPLDHRCHPLRRSPASARSTRSTSPATSSCATTCAWSWSAGRAWSAERGDELQREIVHTIKHKVIVTADVEVVDYGSLPRSERKTKRVFDNQDPGLRSSRAMLSPW